MKKYFILLLVLSQKVIAQDVISLKNGDEIKAKIQEINPKEIKYKRFDNLNGPLITILKASATSIRYENGAVEELTEITKPIVGNLRPERKGFMVGDVVSREYYGNVYQGTITEVNTRKNKCVVNLDKKGRTVKVNSEFYELTLIKPVAVINELETNIDGLSSSDLFLQGQQDAQRYYSGYHGAGTGTFFTALLAGPIIGLIPAAACSSTQPRQDRLGLPNTPIAQNSNYLTGYTQEAHRIKTRKVWGNFGAGAGVAIAIAVAFASSYR